MNGRCAAILRSMSGVRYEYVSPFTELTIRLRIWILSPGVLNPALEPLRRRGSSAGTDRAV